MSEHLVLRLDEKPGVGRLGRHVHHDPRSREFPAKAASALKTVRHRHWGPPLDQGQRSSCTGNAMVQALNTTPLRHGRRLLVEDDAVALYSRATQLDPFPGQYPPDDTGSDGLDVCKAAKEAGYISSYAHAFGLDEALRALVLSPVITGANWYEGFDSPDSKGFVTISGKVRGGHEFAVVGLDTRHQVVTAINSWGSSYGVNGFFTFAWSDWDRLLKETGDVTVPQR